MAKKKEETTTAKNDPFLAALAECKKEFGAESIMTFDDSASQNVVFSKSGSLVLDKALGGGYPMGRIVEIYGPESSGKTTVCLHAVAEVQKNGGRAVYIDAEHALDPGYARALGVDIKNLAISQPDCAEQVFDIAEKMIPFSDVIVIDSVAAMVPKAERDGEMSDHNIGLHARIMSKGLRKITSIAHKSGCLVIFVNQIRMKIGVMFGNPETTTGGNALKFYASQRLEVRRTTSPITEGEEAVGNMTKVKVIKNKVAPPFRTAEFEIRYSVGINKIKEVLDMAVKYDFIEKSGAWFSYNGEKIGQGGAKALQWLTENEEVRLLLTDKIHAKFSETTEDLFEEDEYIDPETGEIFDLTTEETESEEK